MNKVILYLVSLLLLISCNENEINDYHYRVHYTLPTFIDYDSSGVYLIDNRYFMKNVLYRFDFNSENWAILSDGKGFPVGPKIGTRSISNAFSISSDTIVAFVNYENYYVYSHSDNAWEMSIPAKKIHLYPNYFGYNKYSKVIKSPDSKIFAITDTIYTLNGDMQWESVCQTPNEMADTSDLINFKFIGNNSIWIVSHPKIKDYTNYDVDQDTVFYLVNFNLNTKESTALTKFFSKIFPVYFYLEDRSLFTINFTPVYHDYYNNYIYYHNYSYNTFGNNFLFKNILGNSINDTLVINFENPENINVWNETYYYLNYELNLYYKSNYYYLFYGDLVYKYSNITHEWTQLQSVPFKTLNAKN